MHGSIEIKGNTKPGRMNKSNGLPGLFSRTEARHSSPRLYTWLAIAVIVLVVGIVASREFWLRAIGNSLVYQASVGSSDAILIDNVEINYLLFERAQRLESQGLSTLVLVPVFRAGSSNQPGPVELGFVNVVCDLLRLNNCTTFAAPQREPISLNLAKRCAEELRARRIHSVILVTEGFRSRRAAEIYLNILKPLGITVYIQPVFGHRTPENWFRSPNGSQEVVLQFAKLWYYKLAVL